MATGEPSEHDRDVAEAVHEEWITGPSDIIELIAEALAVERERVLAPFLALCDPETSGPLVPRAAIRRTAEDAP